MRWVGLLSFVVPASLASGCGEECESCGDADADADTDTDTDADCQTDADCGGGCHHCYDGHCEWGGCEYYESCDDDDDDGYFDPHDPTGCLEMGPWDCNDRDPTVTDVRACFSDPYADTNGIGACVAGSQACDAFARTWTDCTGEVEPTAETCDGTDEDCDGEVDDGVC